MRETRSSGSVEGVRSDVHSYSDRPGRRLQPTAGHFHVGLLVRDCCLPRPTDFGPIDVNGWLVVGGEERCGVGKNL